MVSSNGCTDGEMDIKFRMFLTSIMITSMMMMNKHLVIVVRLVYWEKIVRNIYCIEPMRSMDRFLW